MRKHKNFESLIGEVVPVQPGAMALLFVAEHGGDVVGLLRAEQDLVGQFFQAHAAKFVATAVNDGIAERAMSLLGSQHSNARVMLRRNFHCRIISGFNFAPNCIHDLVDPTGV